MYKHNIKIIFESLAYLSNVTATRLYVEDMNAAHMNALVAQTLQYKAPRVPVRPVCSI